MPAEFVLAHHATPVDNFIEGPSEVGLRCLQLVCLASEFNARFGCGGAGNRPEPGRSSRLPADPHDAAYGKAAVLACLHHHRIVIGDGSAQEKLLG